MNRRPLAAIGAALCLMMAHAGAAAPAPEDLEIAKPFAAWMRAVFAVPQTADLDAPLREAMGKLTAEHLARLDTLVPAWIAEERARSGPQVTRDDLVRQTRNRLINEIALWRLDSPGAAYDAIYLKAALKPGMCEIPQRDSYLGRLVTWLQAVPPADRPAVLAGERELLARWGRPRTALPARPVRSLSDEENDAIAQLAAGDAVPDVAMAPVVADAVFGNERTPLHEATRCALHQWGLARALHRGEPAAASLLAWRYEMLMTVDDWGGRTQSAAEAQAANGWPPAARASAVEGSVDVRVTTDALGRFASGQVVGRHLKVPGIVDERPVAFETALDEASLAKAAVEFKPVAPPADGRPAAAPTIRLNWILQ